MRSFVDILTQKLNSPVLTLNPHEIKLLNHLISEFPESLNAITEEIKVIENKGSFSYHDIPQIILIIVKVYKTHILQNAVKSVGTLGLVQFTIDALLESGILPISGIELYVIEKLVDVSVSLLKTNPDVVHKVEISNSAETQTSKPRWIDYVRRLFCPTNTYVPVDQPKS